MSKNMYAENVNVEAVFNRTRRFLRGEFLVNAAVPPTHIVWKTITLGTYKDLKALKAALKSAKCEVSDYGNHLLDNPAFTLASQPTEVDLVARSVEGLGFEGNATYARACIKAVDLGLRICPAEVGPMLRLAYINQPRDEWLSIAMRAITGPGGYRGIFRVGHGYGKLWLRWLDGNPGQIWNPRKRLVFVLPRK